MATTKKKLAELIQRIYARYSDKENINRSLDIREVKILIEQAMNKVLKAQTFERFTDGYIDIPRCNLVKYQLNAQSESSKNRAYVDLPTLPISLPMDMGVWQVNLGSTPWSPYIPISSQDWQVMGVEYTGNTQTGGINTSYLEQQTGYYVQGRRIYFTNNITGIAELGQGDAGIQVATLVEVYLLVSDLSQLGDNDILPLSPEYESDVIQEVLRMIGIGQVSQAEIAANEDRNT